MPLRRRPKVPAIYSTVADLEKNTGVWKTVHYTAHAINTGGVITALGGFTDTEKNEKGHPDVRFWEEFATPIKNVLHAKNPAFPVARIEIDCSLMPCAFQFHGCLYQVPKAIRAYLKGTTYETTGIDLRIFSHRSETGTASRKVIFCNTNDESAALTTAYQTASDWIWVDFQGFYLVKGGPTS